MERECGPQGGTECPQTLAGRTRQLVGAEFLELLRLPSNAHSPGAVHLIPMGVDFWIQSDVFIVK